MSSKEENARLILAASTGGHLAQLVRIAPTLDAAEDSLWITFDTEQSRSLLKGKRVEYVPYISPRDIKNTVAGFRRIRDILASEARVYQEAVSTGSAIALSALFAARSVGIPARYIESVSRTAGPSISGKILAASRLAALQTQHAAWADRRWQYRGTVMNAYAAEQVRSPIARPRLFVTLGTIKPYRFDSMIDGILKTGLCDENTVWQVGCTTRSDLPGSVHIAMSDDEFSAQIEKADVVITHSGVGTILKVLDYGKFPVVIPRRKEHSEHVDDHQNQIAELIAERNIGASVKPDGIDSDVIVNATTYSVIGGAR